MEDFNIADIKKNTTNLIEASAGTGKTHCISNIYTKLLLLENIRVEQILVVTFTNDAANELMIRLRTNIVNVFATYKNNNNNHKSDDDFINNLVDNLKKQNEHEVLKRFNLILNNFDKAKIFTIHSFCNLILKQYPTLCNYPFSTNLDNDNNKLVSLFTNDFYREFIVNENLDILLSIKKSNIENLSKNIDTFIKKHHFLLLDDIKEFYNLLNQNNDYLPKINKIVNETIEKYEEFKNIINDENKLLVNIKGNIYIKEKLKIFFDELASIKHNNNYYYILKTIFNNRVMIEKLTTEKLKKNTNKNKNIDNKTLEKFKCFDVLNGIINEYDKLLDRLIFILNLKLLDYINKKLEEHKAKTNNRDYNDIIIDLYLAINNLTNAEVLIKHIQELWEVVLIDEFQDTDRMQYEIFKKLFIDTKKTVFLVGDPKQSIYAFRNADIFSYIKAKQDIENKFSLSVNYRSQKLLIEAINIVFSSKKNTNKFILDGIEYQHIKANKDESLLLKNETALTIFDIDPEGRKIKKDIQYLIAKLCAEYIAYLLENNENISTKDFAIIVSTNNEANIIANALKKIGLNAKKASNETIFQTDEAIIIDYLIRFILTPKEKNNLSFLLSSNLFKKTGEEIKQILEGNEFENYIQIAITSLKIWKKTNNFYNVFIYLNKALSIEINLIKHNEERTLTNLYHLVEIISNENYQHTSILSLHNWLQNKITINTIGEDENLLRLESDESLITITTIHKAKGLQYNIVFCPFLFLMEIDTKRKKIPPPTIFKINADNKNKLIYRKLATEKELKQEEQEKQAEIIRLFYVAMTRAINNLFIFNNKTNDKSLLFSLLTENDENIEDLTQWFEIINKPKCIKVKSINYISKVKINKEFQDTHKLISIKTPMLKNKAITYTSFSAIMNRINKQKISELDFLSIDTQEIIDYQNIREDQDIQNHQNNIDIFSFPRGINTGLCWHEILEKIYFHKPIDEQISIIEEILFKYNLKLTSYIDITKVMIDNTINVKLNESIKIKNFSKNNYLPEIKFTLKFESFNIDTINKWLLNNCILPNNLLKKHIKELIYPEIESFLNGFIDLTYINGNDIFIIDYKSNYLGDNYQSYNIDNINDEILKHHYYLQAIIYAIATYRYLVFKNINFNKINIRFLFLRGIQKNKETGIWKWDISKNDLANLDDKIKKSK